MYPRNAPASLFAGNPDVRYLVLIRQIWHRSRASIAQRVPVAPFIPQQVVEMIVAHLIYDKHSLMACSLTCRSWYIASVPHLHHTLVMNDDLCGKRVWPKPLRKASKHGLLPFVKKLKLFGSLTSASGVGFNPDILRQISGLTNVRELEIDGLDIPAFTPKIQKHFDHFLPRLQSLFLRNPEGSNRQIIFFIGLFQRLEDLTFDFPSVISSIRKKRPLNDPRLIPPSTPPLRGRLEIIEFDRPQFLEEMIDLFGGIRFRYISLFRLAEPRLLLNACAETLEAVQLCPLRPWSQQSPSERARLLANDFTVSSSLFNLSKNKSLQTLEVLAGSLTDLPGSRMSKPDILTFLKTVLSTITSPTFSELIVSHWGYNDFWYGSTAYCIAFHPYHKPNY